MSPLQEEQADATGEKLGLWRFDRALEGCSGALKPARVREKPPFRKKRPESRRVEV